MFLQEFDRLVNCQKSALWTHFWCMHHCLGFVYRGNTVRPLCTSFHGIDETSGISKSGHKCKRNTKNLLVGLKTVTVTTKSPYLGYLCVISLSCVVISSDPSPKSNVYLCCALFLSFSSVSWKNTCAIVDEMNGICLRHLAYHKKQMWRFLIINVPQGGLRVFSRYQNRQKYFFGLRYRDD